MQKVTLFYTSDTHGYLFPNDYTSTTVRPMGLLQATSHFSKDENTLIIDGGDTLQGSALAKYSRQHASSSIPQAKLMRQVGYDISVVGNHDFNYGYDVLSSFYQQLGRPCLCANVQDVSGGIPFVGSMVKKMGNGLTLGFVGIVTDFVNLWEKPEHLTNFVITDAFEAAKKALKELKNSCDVSICVYHGGYECDLKTGKKLSESTENVGCRIAKELDFDLLLCAHQHMDVSGFSLQGTHTLQLPANASKYAKISIIKNGRFLQILSENLVSTANPKKADFSQFQVLEDKVQTWLEQPIGRLHAPVEVKSKLESALSGSSVADFFNHIQLSYSHADFSCTSLGNTPCGFAQEMTIRQIVSAYQFPNSLMVLEVTEEKLRQALERCAEYYTLVDGKPSISESFIKPKIEHYNYDYFAGFSYTFDISRPIGDRVVRLLYEGQPLGDATYTLCMNNYRASGTGGYEVYQRCRIVEVLSEDVQDLAIEYCRAKQMIPAWDKADFEVVW